MRDFEVERLRLRLRIYLRQSAKSAGNIPRRETPIPRQIWLRNKLWTLSFGTTICGPSTVDCRLHCELRTIAPFARFTGWEAGGDEQREENESQGFACFHADKSIKRTPGGGKYFAIGVDSVDLQAMNWILTYLKGVAMGSADVVPGVSGGTIAFITGIYDRLLGAISSVNGKSLKLLFTGKILAFLEAIDYKFLLVLFAGIGTAIVSLAKLITYLLKNHEVALWSFFFGLIIASSILIIRQIKKWNAVAVIMLILGTAIAWYLTSMKQVQLPDNMLGDFFAGFVAIIAMILPGISGSYILVMLGKYEHILGMISNFEVANIPSLALFATGCISGLLVFARILKWLLAHYHDIVVAALVGFMIGSLNKVWPWKITLETYLDRHGETKPLVQENIAPPAFDSHFFVALALAIGGLILVLALEKLGNKMQKESV